MSTSKTFEMIFTMKHIFTEIFHSFFSRLTYIPLINSFQFLFIFFTKFEKINTVFINKFIYIFFLSCPIFMADKQEHIGPMCCPKPVCLLSQRLDLLHPRRKCIFQVIICFEHITCHM